jgi:tellurite resistance protein TerC
LSESTLIRSLRGARRLVIALIGGTTVLLGLALVVLPGPAVLVIPLGLGILGLEFAWARRWLERFRVEARRAAERIKDAAANGESKG